MQIATPITINGTEDFMTTMKNHYNASSCDDIRFSYSSTAFPIATTNYDGLGKNGTASNATSHPQQLSNPGSIQLIVVGSMTERVLFELYLGCSLLVTTVLNLAVMIAILKDLRRLRKRPEHVLILGDSVNNLILAYSLQLFMMWSIGADNPQPTYYICEIQGTVIIAAFVFSISSLTLYAFERYYFLCHPLEYNRHITVPIITAAYLFLYAFAFVMAYACATTGHQFFYSIASCVSKKQTVSTTILFAVYGAPSLSMCVFSVIKIKGLQSRSVGGGASHVAAPRPGQVAVTTNKDSRDKRRQISAVKTILLTSGSFFMTLTPMSAVRLGVLNAVGVTNLELRRPPVYTILFRISYIIMVGTVTFLNPLFYLIMRKGLRVGVPCSKLWTIARKRWGRMNKNVVDYEPSYSDSGIPDAPVPPSSTSGSHQVVDAKKTSFG